MKASLITVCYQTPHLIRLLLRGLERAQLSFPCEYFLVDNGHDGTADMVRANFPWVQVISAPGNVGFAAGNNLAIREAKGEYIILVNPDLTVMPGEMEKLVSFADAHPEYGLIGPRLEHPNGERQATSTRFPSPFMPLYSRTLLGRAPWGQRALERYHQADYDHETVYETDALYGAAMLIRRSVFERIGLFDERFFMYYEDIDLCRRAWAAGFRVAYAPVACFIHYHQRQSVIRAPWEILTNRLARIHIASGVRYFLKYRNVPWPRRS